MIRALGPFLLGFAVALAGLWAFWTWIGGATFPIGPTRLPMIYVIGPFLGLALFQPVFSGLTGRWRGWRFWALALPFSAAVWALGVVAVLGRQTTPDVAVPAVLAAHVIIGFALLALTAGAR